MSNRFDVIVIGSGFGGAVSACRLAERGLRVCVLERGQSYARGHDHSRNFPHDFFGVMRDGVWNERTSKYGLIEYLDFPKIDVIQGAGVGGGSLHYYGATLRMHRFQFERLPWPVGLTYDSLLPHYATAERMLHVAPIQPTLAGGGLPARTQAFQHAVHCAGGLSELVPLTINFGQSQERPICDFRGNCLIGCNISAKNTLDTNYLQVAVENGAEIWPLCKARNIEPMDAGYRVHFYRLAANCHEVIEGTRVIISASSLGSTELLLRCKFQYRTLPRISPALGCHFSSNGDYLYAGTLLPRGTRVFPTQGPNITSGATFLAGNEPFYVEDIGIPDELRIVLRKTILRRRAFLPLLESFMRGSLSIDVPLRNEVRRTWGRINRFLPYLVMGQDSGSGRVYLDRHYQLCLDWPYDENLAFYEKIRNVIQRITAASGGEYVENVWELNRKSFTAHPLGGCKMGDSIESSVVDARGQVHGYPNLHVVDGSVIPGALGVNPSLTITAVAELINSKIA